MFAIPEELASSNKKYAEAILTLANTAIASAERIAALNLHTVRTLLEDSASSAKTLLEVKDIQGLVALQANIAQPAIEKAVAYSRSFYEIATQTQGEVSKLVEAQFAETNKNIASVLDKAAKNAPAGSDVAVAAVKSAFAAANSAYDSISQAARQVVEITEANLSAATNATVKAAGSAGNIAKARKAA